MNKNRGSSPRKFSNFRFRLPVKITSKVSLNNLVLAPVSAPRSNFMIESFCLSKKHSKTGIKSTKKQFLSSSLNFKGILEDSSKNNDLFYDNDTFLISSLVSQPKVSYFSGSSSRNRKVFNGRTGEEGEKNRKNIKKLSIGCDPYSSVQEVKEIVTPLIIRSK
jgi:hypothetical protein